jgi:hypothetical protein
MTIIGKISLLQPSFFAPILMACMFLANDPYPQSSTDDDKTTQFYAKIKAAREKNDVAALLSLVDEIDGAWPGHKPPGYYRVVVDLCGGLTSTNPDKARIDLVRRLVVKSLDDATDQPIDAKVDLLRIVQGEPDYIDGNLRGEKWKAERQVRARRWLATWRQLKDEKSVWAKKKGGPVQVNVQTPPGTFLPGGVAPKEIKDPVLRKQYEEAIARNSERATVNRMQSDLAYMDETFSNSAKRYLTTAYSEPPYQTEELANSLEVYGIDTIYRNDILADVRKRVAERIEQEANNPDVPAQMVITEVEPPGTSVHHPDRRLRKPVTFNMTAPHIEDVLRKLQEETGVNLTRDDDIQNKYPAKGSVSFTGVPAWTVMDFMAGSKRVEGRWEKDGDGYRLVPNGNPLDIPEELEDRLAAAKSRFWLYVYIGVGALLALAISVWTMKRRQK